MGRWQPAIGDPSFMGWFTVAAYLACAILALFSALAHRKRERRPFIFWSLVSGWILLLAVNIIACSLDRIKGVLKIVFEKNPAWSPSTFGRSGAA